MKIPRCARRNQKSSSTSSAQVRSLKLRSKEVLVEMPPFRQPNAFNAANFMNPGAPGSNGRPGCSFPLSHARFAIISSLPRSAICALFVFQEPSPNENEVNSFRASRRWTDQTGRLSIRKSQTLLSRSSKLDPKISIGRPDSGIMKPDKTIELVTSFVISFPIRSRTRTCTFGLCL